MFRKGSADGRPPDQLASYDAARRRARAPGFEYVESDNLLQQLLEARLERLETLIAKGGCTRFC
jgi:hypothetical protein